MKKKIGKGWLFILVVLPVSWIIQVLLFSGIVPAHLTGLYMFTPALVAFAFFMFSKKRFSDQKKLFTRRTGIWPWVFAFCYPIVWYGIVVLLAIVTGLGTFDASFASQIFTPSFLSMLALVLITMLISVFGEEYGWRGFLLPELTKTYSRFWATCITGLVWGVWHIPSYFIIYKNSNMGNPYLLTTIGVINVSVGAFAYSYIFYMNQNVLPSVLLHAMYDIMGSRVMLGSPAIPGVTEAVPGLVSIYWPHAMGLIITTGIAAAILFTRLFSREQQ